MPLLIPFLAGFGSALLTAFTIDSFFEQPSEEPAYNAIATIVGIAGIGLLIFWLWKTK